MANVVATFTANIAPFQAAMGKLSTSVKAGTDAASNAGQRVGGAMTSIGKASTVAGLAVGAMAVGAIKSYGTFQESINKAAVIAGSSNKSLKGDMKDLETEALSLGKTLPISAEDAGNAMIEMARNGASIKDLKTEFPAIAKASAVAGADLAGTATTVQQAMNIWGGGAKNAAKDSAILAKNANMSNAEVEDMGQAFANVGSTAATLGIGIKDTSTAIGLMSNAGLGAAQGSQDLAHALTQMARPSKVAAGEMQKLGITYTDAQGKFKPFPQILKEVAKATDGMSQSQKVAALTNLYGAAGAKAMLPLLIQTEKKTKSGKSGWDAYSDSLGKVSSSSKAANKYLSENSKNMTKNVGQSLAQMKDAFDAVVKTSIGTIAPQIQSVANALGNFAAWLNKSKSPMAGFVKGLIAWSPAIAIVLVAFGVLSTVIGTVITNFTVIAGALGPVSLGFIAAGAAIAFIATKSKTVGGALNGMIGILKNIGQFIKSAFNNDIIKSFAVAIVAAVVAFKGFSIVSSIVTFLKSFSIAETAASVAQWALNAAMNANPIALIITAIAALVAGLFYFFTQTKTGQAIWQGFMSFLSSAWTAMSSFLIGIWNTLGSIFSTIWQALVPVIQNLVSMLQSIWTGYVTAATAVWNGLVSIASGVWNLLKSVILGPILLLIDLLTGNWTQLSSDLQLIWNSIVSAGKQIWNGLVTFFSGIWDFIKTYAMTVWNALTSALKGLWKGAVSAASSIWKALISFFSGLWNGIVSTTKSLWNGVVSFLKGLWNGTVNTAKNIWNALPGFFSGLWSRVTSFFSSAWNNIKSIVMGAARNIVNGARNIWNGFTNIVSNVVNGIRNGFNALHYFSLAGAGQAIMNSLFRGLQSAWGGVKSFVSGIASWIRNHKGPISYDAKLLIPAGNAIMGGLNQGLQKSFGAVQKTVSGMASDISDNMSANINGLSMAGAQFSSGDVTQSIDASERITPEFYVHNEIVGDKIYTSVKNKESRNYNMDKFFKR